MLSDFKTCLQVSLEKSLKSTYPPKKKLIPPVELEIPADKSHGEFSSNVALRLAKVFRKSPMDLAEEFLPIFENVIRQDSFQGSVLKVEVKKPGFINFYLTPQALHAILQQIFCEQENYGKLTVGKGQKIQIEFVSANPTGPLSVAHARQAAVGDALAHILAFIGFDVSREYYVNDGGNQINILGESIKCRAAEILGDSVNFPQDGYQGAYIKDIARIFLNDRKIGTIDQLIAIEMPQWTQFGVDYLLGVIKKDLEDFRVHFDVWSHESKIATKENIDAVLDYLGEKGFLYEQDDALWFKSTDFGDDKDRVVEKSDGKHTYLTPDIVYHKNKFERKFQRVINIWGPDHHGYIQRLKAAVEALGQDRASLEVLIVQLATLYKNGQPISMSTRRGQFISLREVIDEVGVDAARFFFLMRHIKAHLDFDLELAKKETSENPVYYIQYAHARVHSIDAKAAQAKIKVRKESFHLLTQEEELDLIKKLGSFSAMLMICYNELDPYALVNYLQELATGFHRFYDRHRIIDAGNVELSGQRLALTHAAKIVLGNGLRLLGISAPEKM